MTPREPWQRWELLRAHVEDGVPLTSIAAESGVAQRTLQRWIAAYRAAGLDGLRPRPRGDRGQHRLPAELCQLIEGLALVRPRASIATITRRAGGAAQVNGWKQPSYSVVRGIVTGLDPALATLALDGPVAYRDHYELVWRRAADRPNEQWQADHTELDILVLDPTGKPGPAVADRGHR